MSRPIAASTISTSCIPQPSGSRRSRPGVGRPASAASIARSGCSRSCCWLRPSSKDLAALDVLRHTGHRGRLPGAGKRSSAQRRGGYPRGDPASHETRRVRRLFAGRGERSSERDVTAAPRRRKARPRSGHAVPASQAARRAAPFRGSARLAVASHSRAQARHPRHPDLADHRSLPRLPATPCRPSTSTLRLSFS